MTPDPARQLADTGWRVLQTVQPLVALPVSYRLPEAYESLLLDPMAALSEVCNGLLEWPHTAPAATEHGSSPARPVSRHLSDRVLQRETLAATRPDTPGFGGSPSLEQIRRAMEAPLFPFLDEPGRVPGLPEAPAATHPGGPASHDPPRPSGQPRQPVTEPDPRSGTRDRLDRYGEVWQTASHEPLSHSVPHPVEQPLPGGYTTGPDGLDGEPSPEVHSETQRLAQRERPGYGQMSPGGDRPAGIERLADADPISEVAREGSALDAPNAKGSLPISTGGTRLATSTSRLAAMLRTDAAATGTEEDVLRMAQDGAATSPTRSGDGSGHDADPVDEPDRARVDSRVSVEEIMDRLADELESGFVRTYGSSGG